MRVSTLFATTLAALVIALAWNAIPTQAQRTKPSASTNDPFQVGFSVPLVSGQASSEVSFQVPEGRRLNLRLLTITVPVRIEVETFVDGSSVTHASYRSGAPFDFERPLDLWADDSGLVTVRVFNNLAFNDVVPLTLSGELR